MISYLEDITYDIEISSVNNVSENTVFGTLLGVW